MIARILHYFKNPALEFGGSQLHNEQTFYRTFARDLHACMDEAIIESPFIASNRIASLLPIFSKMRSRGVKIIVNTRHPAEHEAPYDTQAWAAIKKMQSMGIEVLFTGGHHRKLAVLDQRILWEGSLNILSQYDSCEIMRRVESQMLCAQMLRFTSLNKFL